MHNIPQDTSLKFRFAVRYLPTPTPYCDLNPGIWAFNRCSKLFRCRWLPNTCRCFASLNSEKGKEPRSRILLGCQAWAEMRPVASRTRSLSRLWSRPLAPGSWGPRRPQRQLRRLGPSAKDPSQASLYGSPRSHITPGWHPNSSGRLCVYLVSRGAQATGTLIKCLVRAGAGRWDGGSGSRRLPESKFGEMNLEDLEGDAGKGEMAETTLSRGPKSGLVPPIWDH